LLALNDNPTTPPETSSTTALETSLSTSPETSSFTSLPLSTRARLAVAATTKKSRKRKRVAEEDDGDGDRNRRIRSLDREIRWSTFLFFTNDLWQDIVKAVYGSTVDMDSDEAMQARAKVFDSVKSYKNKVLLRMEVDIQRPTTAVFSAYGKYNHVKALLEAKEHEVLKMYKTNDLLVKFFAGVFTPRNFFHFWYYMEGYVEYEDSKALRQFYMRCESIYRNPISATTFLSAL